MHLRDERSARGKPTKLRRRPVLEQLAERGVRARQGSGEVGARVDEAMVGRAELRFDTEELAVKRRIASASDA